MLVIGVVTADLRTSRSRAERHGPLIILAEAALETLEHVSDFRPGLFRLAVSELSQPFVQLARIQRTAHRAQFL